MKTTKEAKDKALIQPCEIEYDLYSIFNKEDKITIADIGACDGLSTIQYSRLFPNSYILAFEPRQDNYRECIENFKEYGIDKRVSIFNACLGEKKGKTKFWISSGQHEDVKDWDTGNKSSSIYPPKRHIQEHPWCKFKMDRFEMNTLDSYRFRNIKFIHIDVQGAELNVFKGATETLKSVKAVWAEVAAIELYKGQPLKDEVIEFMREQGFFVAKDTCTNKYGDCLFVRKNG